MKTLSLYRKRSLVLLTLACVMSACSRPGAPAARGAIDPAAEKIVLQKGTVENRVVATGKVIARAESQLAFARSGRIAEVLAKEGDLVQKGQPLARIDSTDLQNLADQQWANFLAAQAAYSQTIKGPTSAELTAAQAELTSAEAAYADLGRTPSANTLGSLRLAIANAEATLKQRQDAMTDQSPDLANVTAALQNAKATLAQRQAAYDQRAQRDPGVGASPEALDLQRATNDLAVAKASYDKTVQNAQLDLQRAQNELNKARADYNAKLEKATSGKLTNAQAQIEQAKKNLAALQPVAETIQQREAQMQQAQFAWKSAADALKGATREVPVKISSWMCVRMSWIAKFSTTRSRRMRKK